MPLSWAGRKAFAGELLWLCFVKSVRGWRGPLNFDSETVRAMARGLFLTLVLFLLLRFVVAIRASFPDERWWVRSRQRCNQVAPPTFQLNHPWVGMFRSRPEEWRG